MLVGLTGIGGGLLLLPLLTASEDSKRRRKSGAKKKKGRFELLCLAAPVLAVTEGYSHYRRETCGSAEYPTSLVNALRRQLAPLLLILGRREERRQGMGGRVRRVSDIGQAKGGFNRLQ